MIGITVIEEPGEKLSETIEEFLRKKNKNSVMPGGKNNITVGTLPLAMTRERVALAISPNSVGKHIVGAKIDCELLLTPGAAPPDNMISAQALVSYGMSEWDTLTLSSIDSKNLVVTLQRELTTLTGKTLDRQDIPIKRESGVSPTVMLAAAGALLLSGISPEDLY